MDHEPSLLIIVDIEAFSKLPQLHKPIRQIFLTFLKRINRLDIETSMTGDGAYFRFLDSDSAWDLLKEIARHVSNTRNQSWQLVGDFKVSCFFDSEPGKPLRNLYNLKNVFGKHSNANSVVLDPQAVGSLMDYLASEKMTMWEKRDDQGFIFYEIPLSEFIEKNKYVIRIEPPEDLLNYLAQNPERLYRIPPNAFAEAFAELISDQGYIVELTKQTRDGGVDIIAFRKDTALDLFEKYLIECKRYSPENKIGVALVRNLLGAGEVEPHTGLILATTSTFTKPAIEYAKHESVKWKLHLKDYYDLKKWLLAYTSKV